MEKLVRELARMMFDRGLSLADTKVAIRLLEKEEEFLTMREAIDPLDTLDRRTAWGLAMKVTE